jgi:hypothetical protein
MRAPGWALVMSAVAHGVLVLALGGHWSGKTVSVGTATVPPATVRWIAAPSPSTLSPASPSWVAPSEPAGLRLEPTVPSQVAGAGHADLEEAPAQASMPPWPLPDAERVGIPLPVEDAVTASAASEDVDGYLPRKALTVPPSPLADIALAWPAGVWTLGRQTAVFTVFIDETGVVRKMVADGPTLLPTLEATARDTFAATPFAPGQIDGRPVKAMIRIEVVFDASVPADSPPGGPMPSVVSRQNL